MTLKNLPAAPEARPRAGMYCDISPRALERWNPGLYAQDDSSDNTITIYDPIGADYYGDGVTAKRIAGALRSIGQGDVHVHINSPGGDVFEGLAIYNLLREHKGKVTVKVMGLAASAASFIAMAGDEIEIGRAAFFMIHNAWVMAMGNRNDLRDIADWLEPFDQTIADIYQARTAIEIAAIQSSMDDETWIGGREAVDLGWADSLLSSDSIQETANAHRDSKVAARKMDVAMAKAGVPRSERRALMQAYKSDTPSAVDTGMPGATDTEAETADAYAEFQAAFATFNQAPENTNV